MFKKILVANRGEIAVRLVRAIRELGALSVAVYARDDQAALHVQRADLALALSGAGPSAYLDAAAMVELARAAGCDAVHPGYGFLSERADFARACGEAGISFIGPRPEHLDLFGDKARARALAIECGVPVLPGSSTPVTLEEAESFFASQALLDPAQPAIMIKAIGGGGGRGMRVATRAEDVADAYARCRSEARTAFGVDGVYVEALMRRARHIEIQILSDGARALSLGERECTLQRRFQKLVEIAPSPTLNQALRQALTGAALSMSRKIGLRSLATFEFLVNTEDSGLPWAYIETNARLQVEHTVTEETTGVDLVQAQIQIAAGATLADLGWPTDEGPRPVGYAIQWRINAESSDANGNTWASGGTLLGFDMASGPGIRIDTHAGAGAEFGTRYDTLLAKLVVHHRAADFAAVVRRSQGALAECRITGLASNLALLRALAARPEFAAQSFHTRFLEDHQGVLFCEALAYADAAAAASGASGAAGAAEKSPLSPSESGAATDAVAFGQITLTAPMACQLLQWLVVPGEDVAPGQKLLILEAMKMEHVLCAEQAAKVVALHGQPGDGLNPGDVLVVLEPAQGERLEALTPEPADPDRLRADLQRVIARHAFTLDENRPEAVARRHGKQGRTARENIADLCELQFDPDAFIEYGALAIAAQTRRRTLEDLIANTPADGMVTGLGQVNARLFGAENARCAVLAYDYTVLAGTQGMRNHQKTDRMIQLARELRLPVVLFAEGGGGRPGDVDIMHVAGLNNHTFSGFAALSGVVPVVGIVHGPCFAGNAALLGCCDVIIATSQSFIGMSGPAMIEGGGLGTFRVEQIGPSAIQSRNGVIDVLVADEAAAVQAARSYLAYFQGRIADWQCADQRGLRLLVPEQRRQVYDMRTVLHALADTDSVLELRSGFGAGMLTALARIEGRPVGLLANNPLHLGGAIDADAADKAARFMQLCNAHGLPIVSLTDTPGFMVGPDIEARAQVRHTCRMFVVAAHLTVPFFAVVLRKGYGLGAQAMTAGGFDAPVFTVAWPTGEFGAMGLEGAVRLGYRKELAALPEGPERDALFARLVAQQYANGEAINMAATLEIDAVIDPATTRNWLVRGLESSAATSSAARTALRPAARFIDTW